MARTVGSEGARTEAAIRAAAVALIARRGFDGVSMRRLAEAVGVQAGALYRYFPTKQALLQSMMREHMRALLAAWRAESPGGGAPASPASDGDERRIPECRAERASDEDPAALLEAFARFHVRYHMSRRDEVFINYMELRSLRPENAAEIIALRDEYEGELRRILEDGRALGRFDAPDVPVAAMALIAMLTGVAVWRKADGRLSAAEIEDLYARLALASVGAEPRGA